MQHEKLVGHFPTLPKQQRSREKREALIESGRLLFNEKGYDQTTAKDIAAHARVATGTFYRYFSDKRQLLMSLIEHQLEAMMPPDLEWRNGDPEKLLAGRLEMHYHNINKENLQRLIPELLVRDAELAEIIKEARERLHKKVESQLLILRENGLMWPDIDSKTLTWCLESLLENLQARKNEGLEVNYKEFAKVFCRILFPPEAIQKMRTGQVKNLKGT